MLSVQGSGNDVKEKTIQWKGVPIGVLTLLKRAETV